MREGVRAKFVTAFFENSALSFVAASQLRNWDGCSAHLLRQGRTPGDSKFREHPYCITGAIIRSKLGSKGQQRSKGERFQPPAPGSSARLELNVRRNRSLKRHCALVAIAAWLVLLSASAALADCKDEVHRLAKDINDNRNGYTVDSRTEAQKELAKAEAALLRAECREYLDRARQALKKK